MPHDAIALGAKFSDTASARSTRRFASATPRGSFMFSVSDIFPALSTLKNAEPSMPWRLMSPYERRKSGRVVDSIFTTVAPALAKYRVAIGPAAPDPNSSSTVPAHAPAPAPAPAPRCADLDEV